MKLEKFKEVNKKKKSIIIFTLCCIFLVTAVFFYQSFALFETKENFNFIEGQVQDPGDLSFRYYIDGEMTLEPPSRMTGYTLTSESNCTNGVTVRWNHSSWTAILNYSNYSKLNSSQVRCNLYFEKKLTVEEYLLASSGASQLREDSTTDNNLRYVGANPKNYIDIGDRDADGNVILWRIIGSFNNIKQQQMEKFGESRLKIIRSESIGTYSWDTSVSNINNGNGINEWSESDVMKLMNPNFAIGIGGSLYWDRGNGNCFKGQSGASVSCDFTSSGLSTSTKKIFLQTKAVWYTGSNGTETTYQNITTSKSYELERSNNTGKICTSGTYCNDTVSRTTTWTGFIGLISPSDYGYATSGGSTTSRETCLATNLFEWGSETIQDCKNNNWLWTQNSYWTINANASESSARQVFRIDADGHLGNGAAYGGHNIYPSLYLSADIYINGGSGTVENPFRVAKDY